MPSRCRRRAQDSRALCPVVCPSRFSASVENHWSCPTCPACPQFPRVYRELRDVGSESERATNDRGLTRGLNLLDTLDTLDTTECFANDFASLARVQVKALKRPALDTPGHAARSHSCAVSQQRLFELTPRVRTRARPYAVRRVSPVSAPNGRARARRASARVFYSPQGAA